MILFVVGLPPLWYFLLWLLVFVLFLSPSFGPFAFVWILGPLGFPRACLYSSLLLFDNWFGFYLVFVLALLAFFSFVCCLLWSFGLSSATFDASVIVHPVATSVSTNFFALGVILLSFIATDILFIYQLLLKMSTYLFFNDEEPNDLTGVRYW